VDAGCNAFTLGDNVVGFAPLDRLIVFTGHLDFQPEEQSLATSDEIWQPYALEGRAMYLDPVSSHRWAEINEDFTDELGLWLPSHGPPKKD